MRMISLDDQVWLAAMADALDETDRVIKTGTVQDGRLDLEAVIVVSDALASMWARRLRLIAGEPEAPA